MSPLTPWDGWVMSHDHFVIPRDGAGNGWAMMMLLCAKNTGPMKHSLEKLKKEDIYCVQGIKLSGGVYEGVWSIYKIGYDSFMYISIVGCCLKPALYF